MSSIKNFVAHGDRSCASSEELKLDKILDTETDQFASQETMTTGLIAQNALHQSMGVLVVGDPHECSSAVPEMATERRCIMKKALEALPLKEAMVLEKFTEPICSYPNHLPFYVSRVDFAGKNISDQSTERKWRISDTRSGYGDAYPA